MLTEILLYLLIGLGSGFIAGLFGVGGGMIIVPALTFTFSLIGIHNSVSLHLAVGTSLAVIIPTALSAIMAHHTKRGVRWDIFKKMLLGLTLGAFCGAWAAKSASDQTLHFLVAAFALWAGIQLLRQTFSHYSLNRLVIEQLRHLGIGSYGIGFLSALIGIGGGTFTVPFLLRQGVSMPQSVATASAAGMPIAVFGAGGFMLFGANVAYLPQYAIGLVYVPAFVGIAFTSVFSARIGALLAHKLPSRVLKRYFAALLLVVGAVFLHRGIMW